MLAKGPAACHVAQRAGGLSCCPKGRWVVLPKGPVACHVAQRAGGLSCCPKGWWLVLAVEAWGMKQEVVRADLQQWKLACGLRASEL